MRRNKYIYIATRLIVVAAAIYTYFEFKDIARQQQRKEDGTIPTMIVRESAPSESAVWMTLYQHKTSGKSYLDITGDGRLLAVTEASSGKTARSTKIESAAVNKVLEAFSEESLLPAGDTSPGEQLFSEAEWVQGGLKDESRTRNFGPAPLESYPKELKSQIENLRTLAQRGEPVRVERFVVAEPVDPRRRESIENDPRSFYRFIKTDRPSLPDTVRAAMNTPGRHIPIFEREPVQQIEKLRKQSNPKAMGNDFFLATSGGSFQLQLLPGT